jgi:L-glyceraldehyde 3-phosphate reductase
VAALDHLDFTADELAAIDRHAVDGGSNLREKPSPVRRAGLTAPLGET